MGAPEGSPGLPDGRDSSSENLPLQQIFSQRPVSVILNFVPDDLLRDPARDADPRPDLPERPGEPVLFPLFLDLRGRPVLVVGGGAVGTSKALGLLAAGAAVTVIAPQAGAQLQEAATRGALRWEARRFAPADLDAVYLAIAATGDPAVNAEVAAAGAARCRFVNAVDDPGNGSAYSASLFVRGPVTLALSTAGRAPAVARLVRELLEELVPDGERLQRWVAQAEALRPIWRRERRAMRERYRELLQVLLRREETRLAAAPEVRL